MEANNGTDKGLADLRNHCSCCASRLLLLLQSVTKT
jgi:hypothetical protein